MKHILSSTQAHTASIYPIISQSRAGSATYFWQIHLTTKRLTPFAAFASRATKEPHFVESETAINTLPNTWLAFRSRTHIHIKTYTRNQKLLPLWKGNFSSRKIQPHEDLKTWQMNDKYNEKPYHAEDLSPVPTSRTYTQQAKAQKSNQKAITQLHIQPKALQHTWRSFRCRGTENIKSTPSTYATGYFLAIAARDAAGYPVTI